MSYISKLWAYTAFLIVALVTVACNPSAGFEADRSLYVPRIFSDAGIVQADQPIPVWGKGAPGDSITVQFGSQTASTKVDDDGLWQLDLAPLPASFEPNELIITSSKGESAHFKNILIGDVYIAAGQSNMVWELETSEGGQDAFLNTDYPNLRLFEVGENQTFSSNVDVSGHWMPATISPNFGRGRVRKFSAVGFFFGRSLHEETNRPIGIIQVAYGGTMIEAWMPPSKLENTLELQSVFISREAAKVKDNLRRENYLSELKVWLDNYETSDLSDKSLITPPPSWPGRSVDKNTPGILYDSMLSPIVPYGVKGMIWYQGESNHDNASEYEFKLSLFLEAMREIWPELPIGIVQIAPFIDAKNFPEIWQAQLRLSQNNDNTGLVVITDLGNPEDIHPRRKQGVGERLAIWALNDIYNLSEEYHVGPLAMSAVVSDPGFVDIDFTFSEGMRYLNSSPISGFEVASSNGNYIPVPATIQDSKIRLDVSKIKEPKLVRYEWRSNAYPLLTNNSGFPASPFALSIEDNK